MKRILFAPDSPAGLAPAPVAPTPAKPAAAPAATPSPAPAATPSPAPASPAPEPSDDPFTPPKKVVDLSKPADGKVVPVDLNKLPPKELRERVKQLNGDKETLSKKVETMAALEKKIADYEAQGKDTSALTTRLTAVEKERDAAQAELRAARQEASPEFKEKFDKPFNQAAERAKKQITELTVTDSRGVQRPATWADFVALYSLPVGKAIEQANALFEGAAQFVLQQREKLLDLDTARAIALDEEKAQFKERSAKDVADQAVKREGISKLWQDTNKRLAENVGDYKDDPTDTEAVDARKHAISVFDESLKVTDDDWMVKKILKDAHIRQRIGSYAVQKLQIERLKADKEALQKQVDELKGVEPGKTQRPGGDAPAGEENDSWEAGLLKAVKG
jgi:hypothetical protein